LFFFQFWLNHENKIKPQLNDSVAKTEPVFNFEVKFYPPDPKMLQEEITRYLLTLQLRHDIMDGKLPCASITHAILGSYTAQAELGDYDNKSNASNVSEIEYLKDFFFAPNQTPELLAAIADYHKKHKGQSPAEAEMFYLENAVKLAMYGVDLHNAKDADDIYILIGVGASGLLIFRDHLRINRFAWYKIVKMSYKQNNFDLKLRSSELEKSNATIRFKCPNHKAAKRLWKIAVEHHLFFYKN
jgi:band 4.1-like protein 1/2/3